jgi:hypothetical protein
MSERAIEMFLELYRTRLTPEYQRRILDRVNEIYLERVGAGIIFITKGMHPVQGLKEVTEDTLNALSPGDCFGYFLDAILAYSKGVVLIADGLKGEDPVIEEVQKLMRQITPLAQQAEDIIKKAVAQDLAKNAEAKSIAYSEGRAVPPEELGDVIANILKHSREG